MIAIGLALGAALSWGVSDFIGGLETRRVPVLLLLLLSQAIALVPVCLLAIAIGLPDRAPARLLDAAVAGVLMVATLLAFYKALSIGQMSIVAPITASGVVLPVIVGIASGNRPAPIQFVGIVSAILGIVLVSRHPEEHKRRAARASIVLALVAACGAGSLAVVINHSAPAGVLWTVLVSRVSLIMTVMLIAAVRPRMLHGRRDGRALDIRDTLVGPPSAARPVWEALLVLGVVGVLDVAGTAFYAGASRYGQLSIVAVLAEMFPVTTVVLARVVLGERVARIQEAGIIAALTGVALVAAG